MLTKTKQYSLRFFTYMLVASYDYPIHFSLVEGFFYSFTCTCFFQFALNFGLFYFLRWFLRCWLHFSSASYFHPFPHHLLSLVFRFSLNSIPHFHYLSIFLRITRVCFLVPSYLFLPMRFIFIIDNFHTYNLFHF